MGKNYTLYIKHDRFKKEPNKSGIVNELLAKYYGHARETVTENPGNSRGEATESVATSPEPTYTPPEEAA